MGSGAGLGDSAAGQGGGRAGNSARGRRSGSAELPSEPRREQTRAGPGRLSTGSPSMKEPELFRPVMPGQQKLSIRHRLFVQICAQFLTETGTITTYPPEMITVCGYFNEIKRAHNLFTDHFCGYGPRRDKFGVVLVRAYPERLWLDPDLQSSQFAQHSRQYLMPWIRRDVKRC